MKHRIITIGFVFLVVCCNNEPEIVTYENSRTGEIITYTLPYGDLRDFSEIAKEKDVDYLLGEMIGEDCVYERAVGIGGSYTYNYACFERLYEIQNEMDWFVLIKHPNPNVRLYAFEALENANSLYVTDARTILSKDTAQVCTFSGCLQSTMQLSQAIEAP